MIDKLDFLVRFWELKARHATLGEPLTPGEQIELLSLMQLVTGDLEIPHAGPAPKGRGLPAQLIGDGIFGDGELRSVSAAALLVSTHGAFAAGAGLIVRITDAVEGVEYTLPCRVIWAHGAKPATVALAVDGIPMRTAFGTVGAAGANTASDWARAPGLPMRMRRQERLLG